MEVLIGKGTSLVSFGITESQAIAILGEYDKSYYTDSGCKRVQYYNHRIELSFEPENDNRLGWIEVHCPSAVFFGETVVGRSQSWAIEYVSGQCNEVGEIDDYGSMVSVSFNKTWVELQFEFGKCCSINLGVLYDENDEPIW
jgi:hypothetical protein